MIKARCIAVSFSVIASLAANHAQAQETAPSVPEVPAEAPAPPAPPAEAAPAPVASPEPVVAPPPDPVPAIAPPPPPVAPIAPPVAAAPVPPATAAPTASPPPAAVAPSSVWYGWQTLAADLTSAGILGAGLLSWTVESTAIGYASFLLATPIVHVVNGNIGRGIGSFALRIFVPVIGGAIGGVVGVIPKADGLTSLTHPGNLSTSDARDVATTAGIGAAIGAGVCSVLDAAVFAHGTRRAAPTRGGDPGKGISLTPVVAIGRSSSLGVGGTF